MFKGHRKAVSYVKFLNSCDLVSASTDSQLKLWNVNKSHCLRSFTGARLSPGDGIPKVSASELQKTSFVEKRI